MSIWLTGEPSYRRDRDGAITGYHGGLLDRFGGQQRSTYGALSPPGNEATQRTLQGELTMNGTEKLAYGALFVLAIALLLTNHLILATVAIVPYVLASFKYSFPQQKRAQQNR